ncbi:dihydroorotate dehydrogenase [Lederbergia wuyishanensis]|uniref:Dihydroorotate dehydrogenase n=1 Tax=Lederbergia wuyishanensis TaxID=1347903 RepID=A0ABU0D683_9BACI|nr:dihydroorotate dehydrogenase [Lederbergia wuyishanensis]MCJ8008681.1 dihydroorotate dehydrogenase [Lederbergia wuyishanensis]MDQ0343900.1 dihydroorotate dehydrogenase [Lederbergia wuyishanensis]
MPDWSYHTIFKPILLKLPPSISREFIHRGMSTLSSSSMGEIFIEFLGHMSPSKKMKKELFGIQFTSPIGLSGKIDPQLSGLKAFQNLGFGFLEIGPVSLRGTKGKEELFLDQKKEQIHGFSNIPIKLSTVEEKLRSLKKKKMPFFIRVEGSLQEIKQICEKLHPYSDGFILNSHPLDSANEFKLFTEKLGKPVIFACSPDDMTTLEELKNYNPSGILLENQHNTDRINDSLATIRKSFGSDLPIIILSRIREPVDAVQLLDNGASLIMLGYDYVFAGPGLPKRINEAYSNKFPRESMMVKGWLWYWLFGLAITIAGFIALLFSMTSIILPYDEFFLGIMRRDILDFNPAILYFMAHDRMTLSGTMISGGIIYMQLARYGIRYGMHWARKAVNIAGIIGFLGILLFIGYGYFDWLHGLFWLILLPLFIVGYAKSKNANEAPSSTNLFNHRSWKLSLIGQLSFVLLGAALSIGGVVISVIGASTVFVPTDLSYLCLTPEMLNEFNERLIPVIAHDRAGFGSALLSVGLLVLMLALWGIREGESWVWWTFTIGAIPAFSSGIITHYIIGYTDFFHLSPAYIAVILYMIGIICTAPYLIIRKKK